ncbi:DUF6907 domain-containing protein [Pseudosporangium ferrugineum]|uniref:DUF6907 domain-containing protein n=1 Tax=Pseudosporangium ferrugineum TaxID=439699 RepID=UPI000D07A0F1|nr:hypothetical protein [Pseudosporangium ferrugineum]
MTTLLEPEDPNPTCLAAITWCNGDCHEWEDLHHSSGFDTMAARAGAETETTISVSVYRTDIADEPGPVEICLLADSTTSELVFTPARARQLSAMLMNAADDADPAPHGVLNIPAGQVRIGDEIDTPDGWQKVNGLLIFPSADYAALFTPEKDDVDSDGYQHSTTAPVRVRRRIHGSTAIAFVEPIR